MIVGRFILLYWLNGTRLKLESNGCIYISLNCEYCIVNQKIYMAYMNIIHLRSLKFTKRKNSAIMDISTYHSNRFISYVNRIENEMTYF